MHMYVCLYITLKLTWRFITIFPKGDNFCDFLFAFLCTSALLKEDYIIRKEFALLYFCSVFSRAHTIVAITFVQKQPNETGQSMTRTSTVNLVDLAGR